MSYLLGKRIGKQKSYDKFGAYDYAVVGVVLAISAIIGIYYRITGGRQRTADEYLLAGRTMGALPVAFSLMASFMSAITLLGVSMEMYQYGTQFVIINLAYVLGTPIITNLILPVFYQLKTASVFEYLEARFGYVARLLASLVFTVQMTLYMGIVLYAPALALEVVTGINLTLSISVLGIVCTFYATLGGMKAVLITDVFQSLLMFASILSVIIVSIIKANGIELIWNTAQTGGRLEFANFSLDPTVRHTWFTQIIGGLVTYLSINGVNQTQVQRLLSTRSLKSARLALWWHLPILIALSLSTCFAGLCMYYYYEHCDPLLDDRITSRDQLLPRFIMDTLGHLPGMAGLCVAGIFSGSLSTISSAISALTAVTLEDYIKPILSICRRRELNDLQLALCSKIISIVFGGICIMLAFLAGKLGGLLQASLSILGIVGGPMLALFLLGMFLTITNQKGVIVGLLTGLAITSWLGFGGPKPIEPILSVSMDNCYFNETRYEIFVRGEQKLLYGVHFKRNRYMKYFQQYQYVYRISYMWYAVIGFLITFISGLLMSGIFALLKCDDNRQIYENRSKKQRILTELFVTPIGNWLYNRQTRNMLIAKENNPKNHNNTNNSLHSYTLNDTSLSYNTYGGGGGGGGNTFHRTTNNDSDYYNESYIDDDDVVVNGKNTTTIMNTKKNANTNTNTNKIMNIQINTHANTNTKMNLHRNNNNNNNNNCSNSSSVGCDDEEEEENGNDDVDTSTVVTGGKWQPIELNRQTKINPRPIISNPMQITMHGGGGEGNGTGAGTGAGASIVVGRLPPITTISHDNRISSSASPMYTGVDDDWDAFSTSNVSYHSPQLPISQNIRNTVQIRDRGTIK